MLINIICIVHEKISLIYISLVISYLLHDLYLTSTYLALEPQQQSLTFAIYIVAVC